MNLHFLFEKNWCYSKLFHSIGVKKFDIPSKVEYRFLKLKMYIFTFEEPTCIHMIAILNRLFVVQRLTNPFGGHNKLK